MVGKRLHYGDLKVVGSMGMSELPNRISVLGARRHQAIFPSVEAVPFAQVSEFPKVTQESWHDRTRHSLGSSSRAKRPE